MAEVAQLINEEVINEEIDSLIHSDRPFGYVPGHDELPSEDGVFVKNFQEHPQSTLLTGTLSPILQQLHPDGQFLIGQDSGIYWRLTEPLLDGAIAPDWFYVPDVSPILKGKMRRSYVLWEEAIAPLIVMEFISETAGGERDRTPTEGKFWIYEKAIRAPFYVIYDGSKGLVDVYHLIEGKFQPVPPNERKHFPIPPLGIELGIWRGEYQKVKLPWLRVWDAQGNLLPTPEERAEREAQRANQEAQRAEQEAQRANQEAQRSARLTAKLRELGIDPDEVTNA